MRLAIALPLASIVLVSAAGTAAQTERRVVLDEILAEARRASPDLLVARAKTGVAHADVGIAGVYPNPSAAIGTSTQAAKLSGTVSIPLVVLGQRGAAIAAARADEVTVTLDTQAVWIDVRRAVVHAYVALWLAEGVASARRDSAAIDATLEAATAQRVEVGTAPELDALRVHVEKVRADADVLDADAHLASAGSELGRWLGMSDGGSLRASGNAGAPDAPPPLLSLLPRVGAAVAVRREQADVDAADARVTRERALIRPNLSLDLGVDAFDETLLPANAPANATPPINYRAQLLVDVPLFHQRGPYIEREKAQGDLARRRVSLATALAAAELTAAYRSFEAAAIRRRALTDDVVPAAAKSAKAMESAYSLGRVPLVALLDAERTLVDTRVAAIQAQADWSGAWADVEHALGSP